MIREVFSLSERNQDPSLSRAFECFHFDSSAFSDYFPIGPLSHSFSEVLLVRSGICRVSRGNCTHILRAGELLFIAPLILHSISSEDGNPVVFDVVKFSAIRLREIPSYLNDLRVLSMAAAHAHFPIQMNAEEVVSYHLDSIIRECILESERHEFAWDLHVRALIYLLITALARFWIKKRDSMPEKMSVPRNAILYIPAYIAQHISEPLRVEDLAGRCNLSYPWFAKCFQEYFGISCKQCIEKLRVETVEQYLVYTDLDLSEISRKTGYADCSHMVKDFRKQTNMTPGQFRSLMKSDVSSPFSSFSGYTVPNHPPKG